MNDLQIDYFLAVARNLSFTKTAEEMYVSQPAISRHISHLEKELGFALFDRSKKTTQLTPAGGLFYDFFCEYRQNLARAKERAYKLTNEQVGSVRLACMDGWKNVEAIPLALRNFQNRFQNVDISLSSYGFKGLLKALGSDKVDVIMALEGTTEDYPDIMTKTVTDVPLKLIYSVHHKFAGREGLTPVDFKDEKLFVPTTEESKQAEVNNKRFCRPYGFVPTQVMVDNIESMLLNVQNGFGVAIIDERALQSAGKDFLSVDLGVSNDVILAWKETNLNPAIGALVSEMIFIFNREKE